MLKVTEYFAEREKTKGRFVWKVMVSQLVRLAHYPLGMLWIPSQKALNEGTLYYARLGFTNIETFRRFIEFKGELYRVSGRPDLINKGILYELKTYQYDKKKQIEIGWAQIMYYTWLTGLIDQRLVLFYRPTKKIVEMARVVTLKEAEKEVKRGLESYRLLRRIKSS